MCVRVSRFGYSLCLTGKRDTLSHGWPDEGLHIHLVLLGNIISHVAVADKVLEHDARGQMWDISSAGLAPRRLTYVYNV